ncbi:MAG: YabP/YqfC family sporulation protein [Erysipelotrichaceae bacterium]
MIKITSNLITIINYIRIKQVQTNFIIIQLKEYTIKINGTNLYILEMNHEEIIIKGHLLGINYEY